MALTPALDLRPVGDPRDASGAPANIEAEQSFLGCVLYAPECLTGLTVDLLPEHFYEPFHGRVFKRMLETLRSGDSVEIPILAEELRLDPAYVELGGVSYLADLVDRAPPATRAPAFAAAIVDTHNRRRLVELGQLLTTMAQRGANEDREHLGSVRMMDIAEAELKKIQLSAPVTYPGVTSLDSAQRLLQEVEVEVAAGRPSGVRTGLVCIDDRLGGLIPTWLVTIGGRPSMGKTALLRNIMYGGARSNPHRLFAMFSLEMPARELSERALSCATAVAMGEDLGLQGTRAIEFYKFTRAKIVPTEFPELHDLADAFPTNLFIDDRSSLTVADVRRAVWALKAKGDLAAISVDYLQLMKRGDAKGRTDAALIGDITQELKQLAIEAKICVLLVSQLNRAVEGRDDKRPQLADLRESGSIEQDSNVVMLVYREAYYLTRSKPKDGTPKRNEWDMLMAEAQYQLEVITAKLRQGSVGTDRQEYRPEYDLIRNWR